MIKVLAYNNDVLDKLHSFEK